MPSKITKHERKLIDEALARGEVTKIERGRSAFVYKWDGHHIVTDKEKTKSKNFLGYRYHPKITDAVLRRRKLVAEYCEAGLSMKLIVERLQSEGWTVSPNQVKSDLNVLGLTAIHHDEFINNQRLELFWRYFNDGVYAHKDLAALLEINRETFVKFLRRNNLNISSLRTALAGSRKSGPHKKGSDPE
jgi:hypothetical protein